MILTDLAPLYAALFVPHCGWPLLLLVVLVAGTTAFIAGACWFLLSWPGNNVKVKISRALHFSPDLVPKNGVIDTIVIGSGSGGCACANMLAQAGQRVVLLEQHEDRTGGCTHTFRLEGCGTYTSSQILY